MDLITGFIVLAIIMVAIGMFIGRIDNAFKFNDRNTGFFQKPLSPRQEQTPIKDDSSKVEAVKRQIERDISATNKPAPANKPLTSSEKIADSFFSVVEQKPISQAQEKQVIKINIEPNEIKSQAASEIIDVPKGVIVKVKRIRIVEHSMNIEWSSAITGKGEVGIKQLVSASIQGEIQRVKGYVLQQTESMEYEITLDGEKHPQYQLMWMDVWLKGMAEIQENNNSYQQPFQFRDRAELKVVPLSTW